MARIKYSALVSDMRNKLNGSVLSKNRGGSYMRNKVTPVNPQTTAQQNVRAAFAANSQAWGGISEAERNGWKALAQELPYTDIFGDSKILAGNALFSKLNGNLAKIGLPILSAAPLKIAVPALETFSVTATGTLGVLSSLTIAFTATPIPAGFELLVYATPGISPGRSFVKNQFRLIDSLAAATATGANLFTAYSAKFGTPADGLKIFVRVAMVSTDSGQQGIPLEAMSIVTT